MIERPQQISICVTLCVAIATCHTTASARPRAPDRATVAYKEGLRLLDVHEWGGAIASFKEAYKLRADASSLFGIAQAYRLSGDCVEALGYYETFRRNFPKDKKGLAKVEWAINELQPCLKERATGDQAAKDQAVGKDAVAKDTVAKDAPPAAEPAPIDNTKPLTSPEPVKLTIAPGEQQLPAPEVAANPPQPVVLATTPATEHGAWVKLVSGAKISFYGMLRVDTHYTDSAMNDPRFAMWALSTGNSSFVQGMNLTEKNKNPSFVMHPRLSRFGMDVVSKPIDALHHPTLSGKLEFDFFAGENESRALPRLRHVYGKLSWDVLYILFGQTTDVISPLIPSVNSEAIMWNAGNLGDRQPQIQLGARPQITKSIRVDLQVAAGQEGARTNADLDNDSNLDGDLSAPQLQGRIGLALQHWVKEPITVGLWSVKGSQRLVLLSTLPQPVSGKKNFNTFAAGADFSIPITSFLKVQGEVWQGRNLADLRGGIGQEIDIRTGTELRSKGGWAELLVKPLPFWRVAIGAGVDDPDPDDVQQRGQRSKNRVAWVGNLFTVGAFSVGLDYSRWRTEWVRLNPGLANRFSLSLVFTF